MHIKVTPEQSNVAGFISWKRLAEETFHGASELKLNERITHFEISQGGIKYFISTVSNGHRGGEA